MIRRLLFLAFAGSVSLFGQYVYDAISNYNPGQVPWQWTADHYGNEWPTANTSVIYTGTLPGNPNDYEVLSRLPQSGGNTVHFLRANSPYVEVGAGSCISVALNSTFAYVHPPGHANLNTTQIYTHVAVKQLQLIHRATHPAELAEREQQKAEEDV